MESYGFDCHQSRAADKSIEAIRLGCNLDLGDGRYHFVQMLHDNGGANIEVERTYWPEYSESKTPEEDSYLALTSYIRNEMTRYSMHSSGGGAVHLNESLQFETGARRNDGHVSVRAICGVVIGVELDEALSEQIRSYCESRLLRTVKKLGQPQATGPYRVARLSEFEWKTRFVRLVSGDSALIVEGRYAFAEPHVPCLWISDCCSRNGSLYLDSCRVPAESELQSIETCLDEVETRRSEQFVDCLRSAGVKVGCEDQADGSLICH